MFRGADVNEMFRWLRTELRPTDVVAAPERLSLNLVAPAGRKVLVVDRFFSNPYVNWQVRRDALDALGDALERGACDTFRVVASEYRVTHYLTTIDAVRPRVAESCGLAPAFEGREWVIYRWGR